MDLKKRFSLFIFLLICLSQVYAQNIFGNYKWTHLGPTSFPEHSVPEGRWSANGMGWVESLGVCHARPECIYAGSNSGGLYRSKDGGKSWKYALNKVEMVTGVLDVEVDKWNPKEVWIGTGTTVNEKPFGYGVLYSSNGGKSWGKTGLNFKPSDQKVIWQLARSSKHPDFFLAATPHEIYLTKDRWEKVDQVYKDTGEIHFRHLAISSDEKCIVASGNRLLISYDQGESWEDNTLLLSQGGMKNFQVRRIAVDIHPLYPNKLVALYKFKGKNYIDVSEDYGRSWSNRDANQMMERVDQNHAEILWHPMDSNKIYAGSVRMYFSQNGGRDFALVSFPVFGHRQFMHDDIRAMTVFKNTIWVGHDGGVSKSQDHGAYWTNISQKDLSFHQIYGMDFRNDTVLIGLQDLSTMEFDGENWFHYTQIYGDGGMCVIRNSDVLVMQNGRVRQRTHGAERWKMMRLPFRTKRYQYPLFTTNYSSDTLFAADHHLWFLGNGETWKSLTTDVPLVHTKISHVSRHINGQIILSKDQPTWNSKEGLKHRLWKGTLTDSGYVWEDLTPNFGMLAWRSVGGIATDPQNEGHIVVSLYGFDKTTDGRRYKVFESLDGGKTWVNISHNLPDIGVYEVQILSGSDRILIGTDQGMYVQEKGAWRQLSGKMPPVMCKTFKVDEENRILYAGSYGNGLWKMKIPRKWFR
jgi:photosystem II stability/assembly factor-like uncharacterized protein